MKEYSIYKEPDFNPDQYVASMMNNRNLYFLVMKESPFRVSVSLIYKSELFLIEYLTPLILNFFVSLSNLIKLLFI